jgi:hypothetical protein
VGMTTTPQEPAPGSDDEPILADRRQAEQLHDDAGDLAPEPSGQLGTPSGEGDDSPPEQQAVLEHLASLGEGGATTAGAIADATCFPLPEVRRVLEQLSPDRVVLGAEGEDGTPEVRRA